jgi:hypothetical protein
VTQASRDGCELGHRAVPISKQLLDDRSVITNGEDGREIEGQP